MPDPNVRDHLANERTFLAWVRTAIALVSFGVVIAKLRFLVVNAPNVPGIGAGTGARSTLLGLCFAGVGLATLAFATVHYQATRRAIVAGDYQSSGRIIGVFALIVFALGLVSVLYLLSLFPR